MVKKIFYAKKKNFKNKILFFIPIFIIVLFFVIIFNNNNEFIIIKEFTDHYYIFPLDKKGKLIPNTNKQILHLNLDKDRIALEKNDLIKFSIQLYASINYEEVKKKLDFYLQKESFNNNEFSIVILDHSIGHEYILIYKNFETRNLALDYCYHYLKTIDTCLIVNVQKLD